MAKTQTIAFSDVATLDQNLTVFSNELKRLDERAGPALIKELPKLIDGVHNKDSVLDVLFDALDHDPVSETSSNPSSPPTATAIAAEEWLLESIEIEGFRGINNEGTPLQLKLKTSAVNSVSAPNGVGKSSIFDALTFAIRGNIPKLERLLQAEQPQDYYLNKFHSKAEGTISLTLCSATTGKSTTIKVTRDSKGTRKVSASNGFDGQAVLRDLDREFVLLDGATFQSFIEEKSLDRGRSFSKLLGLAKYSDIRQSLQSLENTTFYNRHFNVAVHKSQLSAAKQARMTASNEIAQGYEAITKKPLGKESPLELQEHCTTALSAISVIKQHCENVAFMKIDIDACIASIQTEEGGPKKAQLSKLIQQHAHLTTARSAIPNKEDHIQLVSLAIDRDRALASTGGDLLQSLYIATQEVLSQPNSDVSTCPVCEHVHDKSILSLVESKLSNYQAVHTATESLKREWREKGWGGLQGLENICLKNPDSSILQNLTRASEGGTLTEDQARALVVHAETIETAADKELQTLATEKSTIEQGLPPSLVAATTTVEAARRLQASCKALNDEEGRIASETARALKVDRLKKFLAAASESFAIAESAMAATRLNKVEPLCKEFFHEIMLCPVVPALKKPEGGENLEVRLANFWGLNDQSAQALLSESFRNAFAVSVYLAAALLYGGSARFIVLDDITSSLDAGHQHHLMELVRTKFALPLKTDGLQLILLSHDTLLEKLFNKHSGTPDWHHQRLEGTARTAVLPQSGAVNKVRDTTNGLLNQGRVDDAAPRIRQYLEYTLHNIVDRCSIPIPLDLVFGDEKRTAGEYVKAIGAAIDLERRAGSLVLTPTQISDFQTHTASIIGNYLAHWSTGQTQAFSATALLGVMSAIEKLPDCFKYTPPNGATPKFYSSLNRK